MLQDLFQVLVGLGYLQLGATTIFGNLLLPYIGPATHHLDDLYLVTKGKGHLDDELWDQYMAEEVAKNCGCS